VNQAAAYIGLEEAASTASKVLTDNEIKAAIIDRFGQNHYDVLFKGVAETVGMHEFKQDLAGTEKIFSWLRSAKTVAVLALNVFVMVKQVFSYPGAMQFLSGRFVVNSALTSLTNFKSMEEDIRIYSPRYVKRVKTGVNRDQADVTRKGEAFDPIQMFGDITRTWNRNWREKIMGGIGWFDKRAVVPLINATVNNTMAFFHGEPVTKKLEHAIAVQIGAELTEENLSKLTEAEKLTIAYRVAETVMSQTQPDFSSQFRSQISKGSELTKAFTMFGSFTNRALTGGFRHWKHWKRTGDRRPLDMWFIFIWLANSAAVFMVDELRDWLLQRQDDGSVFLRMAKAVAIGPLSWVFFLRDMASVFDVGVPVSEQINATKRSIRKISKALKNPTTENTADAVDSIAETIAPAVGLPYGPVMQVGKIGRNIATGNVGTEEKAPKMRGRSSSGRGSANRPQNRR
jgi:hypothetical protein